MYVFFSPFTRRTAQGPDDCRQTTTSPYRGMLTRSSTTKLRPCRAAAATASGIMRVRQIHVLLWLVALSEPAIDYPTTPPPLALFVTCCVIVCQNTTILVSELFEQQQQHSSQQYIYIPTSTCFHCCRHRPIHHMHHVGASA